MAKFFQQIFAYHNHKSGTQDRNTLEGYRYMYKACLRKLRKIALA
ncbi:hypothetical protein [Iningainema tapete]|nr:hypothetical protein [Iningainema tapete]